MEGSSTAKATALPEGEGGATKSRWKRVTVWLGLVTSAVFLYLVLRSVDLAQVQRELQSANYALLALAAAIGVAANLVRAVRWGTLLGYTPFNGLLLPLFSSTMIGYLVNNVLPARLGELARIYVLEKKTGVSKVKSAATIVVERLVDVLLVVALVGLTSFLVPLPVLIRRGVQTAALIFGAIAIGLIFLALRGRHLIPLVVKKATAVLPRQGEGLQSVLSNFVEGLSVLHSPRRVLVVVLLGLLIWGIEWAAMGLVMRAMNLTLPWIAPLFVVVVLALSFVIPAAPGALGTYEFFAIAALTPFVAEDSQALAFALVSHAFVLLSTSVQGLICLWAESLSVGELTKAWS